MRHRLATLLGVCHGVTRPHASFPLGVPFTDYRPEEVSEHQGALLVRLRGGSAMQVRLLPDRSAVLIRTVPLAKATNLEGDSPWQAACDGQLRSWIESNSAIGQWLMSKGFDEVPIMERLAETGLPMESMSLTFPRS